ncbi:MAG: hypothetical protein AMS25_13695 [Gemmatimonas sp. SM23_52]|nr:MAG: hypothetical protein AMS25_13695 [Gemmatimonas sp. SM23_52]
MLELSRVVAQGFVGLEPVAVSASCFLGGVLVVSLLTLAAFAALAMECVSRNVTAHRFVSTALMLGIAVAAGDSRLWAQSDSGQDVPTIEPRYTRLFGADSLDIFEPSISPDGRWVAFENFETADRINLWIAPADGGEPMRLTGGRYVDSNPVWFPGSDRIAFGSTRAAGSDQSGLFVMTLPIDPQTGRAAGPPRQVTIEPEFTAEHAVSPDGKWIAYLAVGESADRALRVLPATGGTARTLLEREWMGNNAVWSPDGLSLYIVSYRADPPLQALMRIPIDGSSPDTVSTWSGSPWSAGRTRLSPDARYLYQIITEPLRDYVIELATIEGQSLGRLSLPKRMSPSEFTHDTRAILAVMRDMVAPLQIVPVGGGPPRQLAEASAYDWPIGWTPDSKQILFATELNGERVLLLAPITGGVMEQVRIPDRWQVSVGPTPPFWPSLSGDGRRVLYAAEETPGAEPILEIFDREDGSSRVVRRSPWEDPQCSGAFWDGENLVHCEKSGDRYEFRVTPPDGPSRLLWAFGADEGVPSLAVRGDRIAFTRQADGESSLFVATAGDEQARRTLTLKGVIEAPVWSPDGKQIAAAYVRPGLTRAAYVMDVLVAEVSPSGELIGEPRILQLDPGPKWWWWLQWLPDGSGFLLVGMGAKGTMDTDVWFVSLDPGSRPVALTGHDPHSVWGYVLSPDGRYVAYSSEMSRGSSLWRVDLDEVLTAGTR